jgi:excisionase family DNA binding protein
MSNYLTPARVASDLDVTEHSVRRWVKEGKLPGFKIGGRIRISADYAEQLAATQKEST